MPAQYASVAEVSQPSVEFQCIHQPVVNTFLFYVMLSLMLKIFIQNPVQ